jgi:hypothetical protein
MSTFHLRSMAAPFPVVMNAHAVAYVVVVPVVVAMVITVVMIVVVISVGGCNSADGGGCCDKGKKGFLHNVACCSLGTPMLHDSPAASLEPRSPESGERYTSEKLTAVAPLSMPADRCR